MRKRTVKNLFDNIMWYTIYLLPILVALISTITLCGGDWYPAWLEYDGDYSWVAPFAIFDSVIRQLSKGFMFQSVYNALVNVFELVGGDVIYWDDSILTYYFAYFISVYIAHLFVDFILFIPRLCHKWMNAFTNAE